MTNRENPIHRIKSYLGSGSGSGSMITDTDPRIRIQIKMIWIRNTDFQRKDCGNLVDSWLRKAFKGTVVNYFCRSKKGTPWNYIFSTLNKLYFRVDDCPLKAAVVTCLISKPMELAKYFCTGKIPFWRILDPFINTSAASLKIATMT